MTHPSGPLHSRSASKTQLGISERQLARLISAKVLGVVRIFRRVLIPDSEIQRLIAENYTPPALKEPLRRRLTVQGNVATIVNSIIDRHRKGAK